MERQELLFVGKDERALNALIEVIFDNADRR